jgi:hypothetical protein
MAEYLRSKGFRNGSLNDGMMNIVACEAQTGYVEVGALRRAGVSYDRFVLGPSAPFGPTVPHLDHHTTFEPCCNVKIIL